MKGLIPDTTLCTSLIHHAHVINHFTFDDLQILTPGACDLSPPGHTHHITSCIQGHATRPHTSYHILYTRSRLSQTSAVVTCNILIMYHSHIYGGSLRTWCELFLFRFREILSRFREIVFRFREIVFRFREILFH